MPVRRQAMVVLQAAGSLSSVIEQSVHEEAVEHRRSWTLMSLWAGIEHDLHVDTTDIVNVRSRDAQIVVEVVPWRTIALWAMAMSFREV